jgi:hypothetical protein
MPFPDSLPAREWPAGDFKSKLRMLRSWQSKIILHRISFTPLPVDESHLQPKKELKAYLSMSASVKRIAMCAKDIEILLGRSNRSARRLLARIRIKLGKEMHQSVTVAEFCKEMGMQEEDVLKRMIP